MVVLQSHVPGSTSGKEPARQCRKQRTHSFRPWVRKIPLEENFTSVFLPAEGHAQRSLAATVHGVTSHMGRRDSHLCGFTELSCGLGPLWGAFRRWPTASFQGNTQKCGGPLILSSPLSLPDLYCCLPGVCPGRLQRFLFLSWDGAVADRPHSLLACPEFWGAGRCLVSQSCPTLLQPHGL